MGLEKPKQDIIKAEEYKKSIIQEINKIKMGNIKDILDAELNDILFTNDVSGKTSIRIKDIGKAIEKMSRKGYTDTKQMTDLVGGKIVTSNVEDIYKLKDALIQNYNISENNISDYIKNPKDSGYRSLHLDLNINNQAVEIQIKTQLMQKAHSITHDTLYKNAENLHNLEALKTPIDCLSRSIYSYYADKDNFFKSIDINKISQNPLIEYIENENKKSVERINSLEKQKNMFDIQEDKFNKASIYLSNIDRFNQNNQKTSIIDKIFKRDPKQNNNENIEIYKEKHRSIGISDWNDYKEQHSSFIKLKHDITNELDSERIINRGQIKLFNQVKEMIEDNEHKEVKELYKDYPESQGWDKDITNKISTLNHFYDKKLTIGEIKGLENENNLAKSIIKALNNIFSKEKGITR